MARYTIYATDGAGKQTKFLSDDLPDAAAEKAYFASLAKDKVRPYGVQVAPEPDPTTTTPSDSPSPPAFAANAPPPLLQSAETPTQENDELAKTAAGMMLESAAAAAGPAFLPARALAATGKVALPYLGKAIRAVGPSVLRTGAAAAGGGLGGAARGAIEDRPVAKAAQQGATLGALGQAGGEAVGGIVRGVGNIFGPLRTPITPEQRAALVSFRDAAQREGRPFSPVGEVLADPAFAGSPMRESTVNLAQKSLVSRIEQEGVPQVRWANEAANRATASMGGPLVPQAQWVESGFGQTVRPQIDAITTRLRDEALAEAAATTKKVSAATGLPSPRKLAKETIADPRLGPEAAAERMAKVREIPQLKKAAREGAEEATRAKITVEADKIFKQKLNDIRNNTNIDLLKVTDETLAQTLRGANASRITALTTQFPELAPTIGRAKLTDAMEAAGGSFASDSFDINKYMKAIAEIGPHNFDGLFGANADPMRKMLKEMSRMAEGRALGVSRSGVEITKKNPIWQQAATIMAGVDQALSSTIGATLGFGVTGPAFGATTAWMTLAPRVYAKLLSSDLSYLDWFTRVVTSANEGTLGPQTARAFAADFSKNILPQLAVRLGEPRDYSTPDQASGLVSGGHTLAPPPPPPIR